MRAAKFRETYWFKMGAATAEQPAVSAEEADPADTLRPVEDRYENPSLSLVDQAEFGLHTGATEALPRIKPVEPVHVPEKALIAEMHGARRIYLGVGALVAAVGAAAAAMMFL